MQFDAETKKILHLIQQSGTLMFLPRTHLKHLGNSYDTIASHGYQSAIIAYCLARMEQLSHDEALQCMGMVLFYNLTKARVGDADLVEKHYTSTDKKKAIDDQFSNIAFTSEIKTLLEDFDERKTNIATCAKDAHSLVQMYIEWVMLWQGNKLAEKWFESDFNDRVPGFKTESAKKLAYSMKDSNPNEWWWSEFLEDDAVIDTEKLIGK